MDRNAILLEENGKPGERLSKKYQVFVTPLRSAHVTLNSDVMTHYNAIIALWHYITHTHTHILMYKRALDASGQRFNFKPYLTAGCFRVSPLLKFKLTLVDPVSKSLPFLFEVRDFHQAFEERPWRRDRGGKRRVHNVAIMAG